MMEMLRLPREPVAGQIILALMMDRRNLTERTLLGPDQVILSTLDGNDSTAAWFSALRPLGSLLQDRDAASAQWEEAVIARLADDLRGGHRGGQDLVYAAYAYLQERISTGEPLSVGIALLMWNSYLLAKEFRDREFAAQRFQEEAARCLSSVSLPKRESDFTLTTFYPHGSSEEEWMFTAKDPGVLLTCCTHRMADWGMELRTCKVCGSQFWADRIRTTLCSAACRRTQAAKNKQAFDCRAKENSYDVLYKNACQTWRNRINRAKQAIHTSSEDLNTLESAFQSFRKQALARKKLVKNGSAPLQEFQEWLTMQLTCQSMEVGTQS